MLSVFIQNLPATISNILRSASVFPISRIDPTECERGTFDLGSSPDGTTNWSAVTDGGDSDSNTSSRTGV